jgi:hypothetical protein
MSDQELTSVFFLYAHNMWEAQERYTNEENFFSPLLAHVSSDQRLRTLSNESLTNIIRSLGTLSYIDDSVVKILEEGRRRAVLS